MDLEKLVVQQSAQIAQLTEMLTSFMTQKSAPPIHNVSRQKESAMPYLREGSLFKRHDGRWEARLVIDGKQRSVACCKHQKDAYQKLKEAIKEKGKTKQKGGKSSSFTLHGWLDHWFKVFRLPKENNGLSTATIRSDATTIRKIKGVFKDIKLKELTPDYIQERINSMDEGRTAELVYGTLKLALDKARGLVATDIMRYVDKKQYKKETGRALTEAEVNQILEASESQLERDVWNFYFYTGCRVSEILRVKVSHVSLDKNEIFIDGTKTKTSKRSMPIFPQLQETLVRLMSGKKPSDKLVDVTSGSIRGMYRRTKEKTGIAFTQKDTRHTCATRCKDAGIPVAVYHKWFGWADETMAKKVYTHKTEVDDIVSQEWAKKAFTNR